MTYGVARNLWRLWGYCCSDRQQRHYQRQAIFAADSVIYGGYSASGGEVSGNILNIKSTGITVSNIKNFDVYNFYLPDTVQAGDVLLTVTGGSSNEQTDLKGSSVNVGITGSAPALKSGDNVTLLHNANGILADETTVYGKMTQGVSLEYDFTTVLQNGDSLLTTIIKSGISDDTKSLVETAAGSSRLYQQRRGPAGKQRYHQHVESNVSRGQCDLRRYERRQYAL